MINNKVLIWSFTIALCGLLFGIDTAVISGAEQEIQKLWNLDAIQHGLTISMALIGTVFGSLIGGFPTDKLGRRKTVFWVGIIYLISSLGSALVFDWYSFLFFRFLGGVGVGISSVAAPLYISEISPASHRGRLVAIFQINIVIGILVAYVSNYLLIGFGENAWRWMLGIEAIPALVFILLVKYIPESPRWLIINNFPKEQAIQIFEQINPATAKQEVEDIIRNNAENHHSVNEKLFSKKHWIPVTLAIVFAIFNQVSGINAIIYFAPRIFEMTGQGVNSSLLATVGIGLINLVFTLFALNFIDRFGRQKLMLIGSIGLIATLGLVSYSFFAQQFALVPIYLFIYIAFFAFSQGAVIWVFISEIFPNNLRAKGQSLGSFTHWIAASIIAFVFPYFVTYLGGGFTFLFFTLMMVCQLVFVVKFMPETKGKSLEKLEENIEKNTIAAQ